MPQKTTLTKIESAIGVNWRTTLFGAYLPLISSMVAAGIIFIDSNPELTAGEQGKWIAQILIVLNLIQRGFSAVAHFNAPDKQNVEKTAVAERKTNLE